MEGPVRLLMPERGVSALDAPGQPFHDPAGRPALLTALERRCATPCRHVIRLTRHINDPAFSAAVVAAFHELHASADARRRREAAMTALRPIRAAGEFHAMAARGQPIIGGGAGIGLSAKCEEAGGIDLIVIYNSGRYRMAGRGSLAGLLAYGNANEIVVEMAREVLPVVKRTPVLAGVNGTDPFRASTSSSRDQGARLRRRAELPHRRPDRRNLPRRTWKKPAWATRSRWR